jgi:hypothetical protein
MYQLLCALRVHTVPLHPGCILGMSCNTDRHVSGVVGSHLMPATDEQGEAARGRVQAPRERAGQQQQERAVIAPADARAEEEAVVVHVHDALVAHAAYWQSGHLHTLQVGRAISCALPLSGHGSGQRSDWLRHRPGAEHCTR